MNFSVFYRPFHPKVEHNDKKLHRSLKVILLENENTAYEKKSICVIEHM